MSGEVLLLDIGNTFVKWQTVCRGEFVSSGIAPINDLGKKLASASTPRSVLCASVGSPAIEDSLIDSLPDAFPEPWFARPHSVLCGLTNSYDDPEKMGVDRWLAMVAAHSLTDERFCVVDAGSALTIDFVAADGRHEGGYIVPGRNLMLRSLTFDTARVRFELSGNPSALPGKSTAAAAEHGALLSLAGSVTLALRLAEQEGSFGAIFVCGGDGELLAPYLDRSYSIRPKLVLEGLYRQALLEGVIHP